MVRMRNVEGRSCPGVLTLVALLGLYVATVVVPASCEHSGAVQRASSGSALGAASQR